MRTPLSCFAGALCGALLFTGCLRPSSQPGPTDATDGGDAAPAPDGGDAPDLALPPSGPCSGGAFAAGHAPMQLLTNNEYDNTVDDLLHLALRPSETIPFAVSVLGGSGFSNDASVYTVSPQQVSQFYTAAESLAAAVISTKGVAGGAYATLAPCVGGLGTGTLSMSTTAVLGCATAVATNLAMRAYRRPATTAELDALVAIWKAGVDFDTGFGDAITALLMSPKFLFISVVSAGATDPNNAFSLDDYQLATRLSYFLWQSMPDDALFTAAANATLHDPTNLRAQVARMIKDPRVGGTVRALADELAGERVLAVSIPGLTDAVRESMRKETQLFLANLIATDASFLSIVTSTTTFIDGNLAAVYGVDLGGADPKAFSQVALPAAQRIGLLTQAGVLTASAGAIDVTHPVIRGKFVASKILCAAPPAQPDNVPFLPAMPPDGQTIRDLVTAHASNPQCNGCHVVMDTVGFALEAYDPFGNFRTTYPSGLPIDTSGAMPNGGKAFTNAVELYQTFADDPAVKACLTGQLLGLAVARPMDSTDDQCTAQTIGAVAMTASSTFTDLVTGIVTSNTFMQQKGEAQ